MDLIPLKKILEEPYILKKPPLKEYYVAYIDILSYKNFFDIHPDKEESLLDSISKGYQNIVRGLNMINSFFFVDKKIELRCFSDNLLVFCEVPNKNGYKQTLMLLIETVKEIQRILILNYGLFVRGAITKGHFAASEMFVFGSALIEAVTKEEKEAKNPRVIISQSVIADMQAEWMYDDPLTQNVCNELVNVYALFESGSTYELAKRCYDAYRVFDKIIAEIPIAISFDDEQLLQSTRNNFTDMMTTIRRNSSNIKILEQVYQKIINEKNSMFRIFNNVASKRNEQIVKHINEISSSAYYEDDDSMFVTDYLSMADFTTIFKPEILKMLLGSFLKELSDFPDEIEMISSLLDVNELNNYRRHIVSLHRKVIIYTLKNDEADYIKYASNKESTYDERIIKKHLWSLQYHNKQCQRWGFNDLIKNCTLSIGKDSSLYVENISE